MNLKFDNLLRFTNLLLGISTKEFGSMKHEDNSINRENLDNFTASLGISAAGVTMHQVHGADVEVVKSAGELSVGKADGMITNIKNVPLCVLVADCLPILFYDNRNKVIGLAHSGRRGLESGVIRGVIDKMKQEFGSNARDIIVGIGPGIEMKCYEVEGHLINLSKMAQNNLLDAGVMTENIENLNICTKCNKENFYSFRRGDISDRFAVVISLV